VQPAELTVAEYNELADAYMDAVVEKMEQLQEERDDVDVEYSVRYPISSNSVSTL
jgi:frataxin